MIPILYGEHELAFDSNGLGMLADAADVTVEEELNGVFELEMQYPVFGKRFAELKRRAIVMADASPVSGPQPFRIYRITKPHRGMVTVYARHLVYDLMGYPVAPFAAQSVAGAVAALKNSAVRPHPFTISTDKTTEAEMALKAPRSTWAALGGMKDSMLDVYGGEYTFDRFSVHLTARRGADRGVSIRYGKNLATLEQDEICQNCYTGVYPYWTNMDGNLVQLPEKVVDAPGEYGYTRILTLDLSTEWMEPPTEEQLRARTELYIKENDIGTPAVGWTVGFVPLEQTEEYKDKALLERVYLGDSVTVIFPDMGVNATARVTKTRYKPLLDRYEDIRLGSVRANIAKTIAQQQKALDEKPNQTLVHSIVTTLTAAILGARGGAVRLLDTDGDGMPDTLYIADNPDPAQAKKVWRFNYEGWGMSQTGFNGPFTVGATMDGLMADAIKAGTLDASVVNVVNLVAKVLESVAGTSALHINGAQLRMLSAGLETIILSNQSEGMPILYLYDYASGKRTNAAELSPHHLKVGGSSADPLFYLDASDGSVRLRLPGDLYRRKLSWKDNGDGTATLIGS